MATKVCSKCKAEKSLDEYYKQRHGKMAKCKTCCKLAAKNNRIAKYGIRTRIKNTYKSGELIIESSVLGEFAIRYDEDDEETLKGYSWRAANTMLSRQYPTQMADMEGPMLMGERGSALQQ